MQVMATGILCSLDLQQANLLLSVSSTIASELRMYDPPDNHQWFTRGCQPPNEWRL